MRISATQQRFRVNTFHAKFGCIRQPYLEPRFQTLQDHVAAGRWSRGGLQPAQPPTTLQPIFLSCTFRAWRSCAREVISLHSIP